MRFAHTNNRSIAQRARRDAEREADSRSGPPSIPHGTVIGRIVIEYHGQRVEAEILQAGDKCRTHGIRIGGDPVVMMGLYKAAVLVASRIARVPSRRSDFWG
jgi:hypothetical protein